MAKYRIEDTIEYIGNGKFVILADDEDQENTAYLRDNGIVGQIFRDLGDRNQASSQQLQ